MTGCQCYPCLIAIPTDVGGVSWASTSIIVWNRIPCADYYNLYKRTSSSLSDTDGNGVADDYGNCDLTGQTENLAPESMIPPTGFASFYIVTGKRDEIGEGTLGYASNGLERPNHNGCP